MSNKKQEKEQVKVEKTTIESKLENNYLIAFCSSNNIIQRIFVKASSIKDAIKKYIAFGYDSDWIFAITNLEK